MLPWKKYRSTVVHRGVVEDVNCPIGTFNSSTAGPNVSSCLPCTAGYYCLEASVAETGKCDQAFYCPSPIDNPYGAVPAQIGSYGPRQAACPGATYANVTGTPNVTSCMTCPNGSYCPLGTIEPIACPLGYYCLEGVEKAATGPTGRYGNETRYIKQEMTCYGLLNLMITVTRVLYASTQT